MTTCMSQGNR